MVAGKGSEAAALSLQQNLKTEKDGPEPNHICITTQQTLTLQCPTQSKSCPRNQEQTHALISDLGSSISLSVTIIPLSQTLGLKL